VPISLDIDHKKRRVMAVVEGEGTLIDGMKILAQIFAAGAVPYAKLIDLNFARPEEGASAIRKISRYVRTFNKGKQPGPLAIVATSELIKEMVAMFDQQVGAKRPIAVFDDRESAGVWLDGLARHDEDRLAG
jgi:hypothetical protein